MNKLVQKPKAKIIKWLLSAILIGCSVFRSYGDVTYAEILAKPSMYVDRQVVLRGFFYSKNTQRNSFQIGQGDDLVEVFCTQLSPAKRSLVWNQGNLSGARVSVTGTVQRSRNARNVFCIMATDVVIFQTRPASADRNGPRQKPPPEPGPVLQIPPAPLSQSGKNPPRDDPISSPSDQRPDSSARKVGHEEVDRILAVLISMTVLLTTIWVGFDARANKITSSKGPYGLRNGALAWVIACVLLWIVAFPYYLVRRSIAIRQRERNLQAPSPMRVVGVPAKSSAPPGAQTAAADGATTREPEKLQKRNAPWHYVEKGKTFGPMAEAYIHVLVKSGQLNGQITLVWQEGMTVWWFYDEVFGGQGMVKRRPVPANAPTLPVPSTKPESLTLLEPQTTITAEATTVKQPTFVKGSCQHCGGHLEFSSLNKGETIKCPHCGKQTRLEQKLALADAHSPPKAEWR